MRFASEAELFTVTYPPDGRPLHAYTSRYVTTDPLRRRVKHHDRHASSFRIELARWHRQEQIDAASVRRIEVEAAALRRERSPEAPGSVAPRLRPQQLRP